jgi:hypothetical protein
MVTHGTSNRNLNIMLVDQLGSRTFLEFSFYSI